MPGRLSSYFPKNIQFFLLSLFLLVVVNLIFRVALFFFNTELAVNATYSDILYALFNIGLRFDLYISLIILLLPFILCSVPFLANRKINLFFIISNWLLIILVIVNIAVSISDLGFFRYYNSRITKTIFDWTDELGIMLKVMLNDSNYLKYLGVFIVVVAVYIFLQIKIFKKVISRVAKPYNLKYRLGIFISSLILIFFGIRGSFNFNQVPLNIYDAFFSENLFLNQLSLNPVYSLAHSYHDVDIQYFDSDDEYINTALRYLKREKSGRVNPFEMVVNGSDSTMPNIILVFLESMSNAMVSRYKPEFKTTPFLDSLAKQAAVFDNFFSAGVHTHNGIFTALYGLPAIMRNIPMRTLATAEMKFYGLPRILKEKNYQTRFYVTGSKNFDNMNNFLLYNGFDKVIGDSDYPSDSIVNNWGVSDKRMFNRVLSDCDSLYDLNKQFFMGLLTISAHEGYRVPKSYDKKISNEKYPYKLYELSDLLLKEFIISAKNKEWFKNTVFVIVGDHGQNFSAVYDMNLNYHRVPLIIYSPEYIDPVVYNGPGLQQDIYPTLFGLLDFSYVNNAMGVDLFKHKRKYAYFSADTKFGIIDSKLFLIYRRENNISMYNYKEKSTSDVFVANRVKADSMMSYGFSMMQSAKYLIDNKLTNITESNRYDVNRFIAHAGGSIEGNVYTNSLEALDASYQKGFRLFELDILKTSDNHYVAAHDWEIWQQMTGFKGEIPPTRLEFKEHQLLHKYTPLDMDDINGWFQSHTDAILVTDKIDETTKFSNEFVDTERLMMEVFTLESLKEAAKLNIRSAMPNWGILKQLKGDKIKLLVDFGVTEIVMSRRDIENNIPFLILLKNRGIKVYVFHVNYDKGKDDKYVIQYDMDYIYGLYADEFNFGLKIVCD